MRKTCDHPKTTDVFDPRHGCKICNNERNKTRAKRSDVVAYQAAYRAKYKVLKPVQTKVCELCKTEFSSNQPMKKFCTKECKSSASKIRYTSKHPEKAKEWAKRNPEKRKAYRKAAELRAMGWSHDRVEQASTEQQGLCAICFEVPERGLVPDHKHIPVQPRGLLCHNCNAAIGLLEDNPARALAAAEYLQKWLTNQQST